MASRGLPDHEFVSHILELAVADSARAWLAVAFDTALNEVSGLPDALSDPTTLIASWRQGGGEIVDGRLTGKWRGVVGARYADWLLLPADNAAACRVLLPRRDLTIDATTNHAGLGAAGVADVGACDLAVESAQVLPADHGAGPIRDGLAAAAAVVGSADGLWRRHVEHLRAQLAASTGNGTTDSAAAQVAWAASDIDAAKLQIAETPSDLDTAVRASRQAVARARSAANRLLEHSRHALDASNPVTRRWREVDAGGRLAVSLLDGLAPPLR